MKSIWNRLALALALIFWGLPAQAQNTATWTTVEPAVVCGVGINGSRVMKLKPSLPHPLQIVGAWIWQAGPKGEWQLAVDRAGAYTKSTHYPATQTCNIADGRPPLQCHEQNTVLAQAENAGTLDLDFGQCDTNPLGKAYCPPQILRGKSIGKEKRWWPPLEIAADDLLLYDSIGCDPGYGQNVVWQIEYIKGAAPAMASEPTSWSTAWSANLTTDDGSGLVSTRDIIGPLTAGGNRVRVTYRPGTGGPYIMRYSSLGKWTGTEADTATQPVEVTFDQQQSGFSADPGPDKVSDTISFDTQSGDYLVVINDTQPRVEADGSTTSPHYMIGATGTNSVYFLNTSTYALQAPRVGMGLTSGTQMVTHGVVKVEVGTAP